MGVSLYSKLIKNIYLKRFLLIVSLFIVSTVSSQAQQSKASATAGIQSSIVRFYPNPATSVITFDFQKAYAQGYSIQIYNAILGRKMFDQVNMPERTTINLSDFSRGVYIYQLRDISGRMVESGKFQVAK
jgi:hypothetical protein